MCEIPVESVPDNEIPEAAIEAAWGYLPGIPENEEDERLRRLTTRLMLEAAAPFVREQERLRLFEELGTSDPEAPIKEKMEKLIAIDAIHKEVERLRESLVTDEEIVRADERRRVLEELVDENPPCKDTKYGCHCHFIDPAEIATRIAESSTPMTDIPDEAEGKVDD